MAEEIMNPAVEAEDDETLADGRVSIKYRPLGRDTEVCEATFDLPTGYSEYPAFVQVALLQAGKANAKAASKSFFESQGERIAKTAELLALAGGNRAALEAFLPVMKIATGKDFQPQYKLETSIHIESSEAYPAEPPKRGRKS